MQRLLYRAAGVAVAVAILGSAPVSGADVICPERAPTPPQSGVRSVTAGDAGRLLRGTVLLEGRLATGGGVPVDAAGTIAVAPDRNATAESSAGPLPATQP